MKILIVDSFHHKNMTGFKLLLNNINYEYKFGNINEINDFDIVYSPNNPIDASNYPSKKFIFGPHFSIFPNPAADILIVQAQGLNKTAINMQLIDASGKKVLESNIPQGGTMGYFQVGTLYSGTYQVVLLGNGLEKSYSVIIE